LCKNQYLVIGEWRKQELNDLYSSPNIVGVIISSRIVWTGRVGERRGICRVLAGKHEGKNHLQEPGVDGRITLRWIFRKWDMGFGLD
jgi:hypothetical protein